MAKKHLNSAEKKVVICHIIGKLKIPNSPSSRVKKPKKLIFTADKRMTHSGRIKDINISILLVLLSSNFCNSMFSNLLVAYQLIVRIVLLDFLFVLPNGSKRFHFQTLND